jgi:photosystem II stability/assembly factor-like uncharacterized protein
MRIAVGLYYDVLNRLPSRAEAAAWDNAMHHGLTAGQMVQMVVQSPEYRINLIQADYQNLLGRSAEPAGLVGWLSAMRQGVTAQQLLAGILDSPEYVVRHGSTIPGWITGLYQDLLHRAPEPAGLNAWLQFMQGGMPPAAVEWAIENSPEAYTVDVIGAYRAYLGRDASSTEINAWVGAMQGGLTLEGLLQYFVTSPEYAHQQQGVDLPFADDEVNPRFLAPVANTAHPHIPGFFGGGLSSSTAAALTGSSGQTGSGFHVMGPNVGTQVQLVNNTWVPIGPAPINGSQVPGRGASTGRTTGLAADPTNANVIYLAASNGGVWKTTDGGTTWTPLTDDQPNLVMGAIAVAPSSPNVIYAGTGQADNAGDSYYGAGVLKSTDGGTTWTVLGQTQFNRKGITKIVVSPTDPNTVLVAVADVSVNGVQGNNGIWRSTDGGTTWTNTTTSISANAEYTDLAISSPSTPQTLFMAIGSAFGDAANAVYKSTDGGQTWAKAGNFPGGAGTGVIRVAVSASTPTTLYASISSPTNDTLLSMQKSTDGGTTWTQLTGVPDYLNGQGFYDSTLAVDPTNASIVYAGGAGGQDSSGFPIGSKFIATTDGGTTWVDASGITQNNGPHADHHAITFDANGKVLVGTDGGIWRLDDLSSVSWSNLNGNLQITTFVGIALDPTNSQVAYGGSQDNGRERFNGDLPWTHIQDGDGGFIRVDASNPQTVYGEFFSISLERSDDGGNTWTSKTNGIGNDNSNFYVPFIIDPSNTSRLLLGTDRVYESTDRADNWTALSSPNSNGWNSNRPVDAVAAAPGDVNTIYASAGGHIFVTTNHGTSWTARDLPGGASSLVTDIKVDPSDKNIVYAVRNVFGAGKVFRTTDGGQTWADITGNLPDIPPDAIFIDKRADHLNTLYLGTDAGVYASTDLGQTWAVLGTGLPNVRVRDLDLAPTLDILAAGTYGRGMWEFTYNAGGTTTLPALSIDDVTHNRPRSGTVPFVFTVTLAQASAQTVTVAFATQNGTGSANVDYTPVSGTLTFAPGEITKTITVQVIGSTDTIAKTFFVNLSSPRNAALAKSKGLGTILGFVPPSPSDRFEPNETSDRATNLNLFPVGTTSFSGLSIFTHPNGFDDTDWYRAAVAQGGTLSVRIDYTTDTGTDLNLRIFTLDPSGMLRQIGSSRNSNTDHQAVSVSVFASEPIFIWVYGFNHTTAEYSLNVTLG